MNWKHWPYWLRGGVLGAIAGLLFYMFLGESCDTLECYIFSYGPGLLVVKFLVFISIINSEQFTDSLIFWHVVIVIGWTLCGIVVGLLFGYIKSIRKHSQFQNLS